jgi:uncharacterized Zn finger protein
VKEFADDSLCVSAGKLFCRACREELSVKKSVIKNHVESMKHRSSKGRLKEKEKRDSDIVDALQRYSKQVHPKGETLSDNTRVYRVKVVREFLRGDIPLQKIDSFRELLEEYMKLNQQLQLLMNSKLSRSLLTGWKTLSLNYRCILLLQKTCQTQLMC